MATAGNSGASNHNHIINGEPASLELDRYQRVHAPQLDATFNSRLEAFGNRTIDVISPPPIRRQSSSVSNRIERFARLSHSGASSPLLVNGTHGNPSPPQNLPLQPPPLVDAPRQRTPPQPPPQPTPEAMAVNRMTPRAQTASNVDWTVRKIITQLNACRQDIREGHSRLTTYILESTKATERRIHHGPDLFANVQTQPTEEQKGKTIRIKSKQHVKGKRDQREAHYMPICTKTNKERVPPYRFHHVEIKKNVLTPNTMLTFVPHLRDLESSEETEYNRWLKELEDIDLKSGFKPMIRVEKQKLTIQGEKAATVSMYFDTWLENMAIAGCNKSALISYMAAREPDDAITPQQKTDILNSQGKENATPGANKAAKMFTDAFQHVFRDGLPASKQIDLRRVLMLDESVDNIMDSKPIVKDATSLHDDEDEDELAETNLATYCILGCLICYSHSCDHGEYDNKNMKRTFSISSCSRLSDCLKVRRKGKTNDVRPGKPCRRQCYKRASDVVSSHLHHRPWSDDERIVLRSLFTTANHSAFKGDAICLAAEFLNRDCNEIHKEFKSLGIALPQPDPPDAPPLKNLSWYDRRRKVLLGDWQDHTISHAHQRRENLEPCSHEGPCAPRICPCVDADVLCEKFCGCTVENCAYKFTGCACHSQGKTCQQNKKEKPCICVQLNRECDPQLCGSCGVLERADPLNANDTELHASGCQNCDLQRGLGKSLLLGQSQLEGCGYGLFTAENIAQDEFIVEYVGELITHDEGVRREARRGNVFDEESNVSYVFTLLENEGIWVDAAIYGNLSRYINHASEHDTRGCNITPRILYVNGEYRIEFTALRDIAAGEELFFNYGENFPNLTKKLLDDKAARKPDSKSKSTRTKPGSEPGGPVPRKTSKIGKKRGPGRPRVKRDLPPGFALERETERGKRKRKLDEYEETDDDYDPVVLRASKTKAGESARDSEEPGSASRLRRRLNKEQNRQQQPETPTKRSDLMNKKARGKRGGARPGSGRPRKHPRPVPKPHAAAELTSDMPTESESPAPGLGRTGTSSLGAVSTPEPKRVTRRSEKIDIFEIEDSDDAAANAPLFSSGVKGKKGEVDATVQQRDDEDEDQDVLVRQRSNRATRTRRPPAKFRDDDIWN
ncbi:hypothetical protein QQS21_012076 [Conoideocrella luteorostrata]|uniref:SET domain-containing protein n=1 Tax=Conoideocrella luteorostrata TaxID=1105319 RepID=A0AAJ0CC69_9HYPO|nr:hypothetical protein QQS21_012076 [Conoideocrella luteorostrata]